VLGLQVFTTLPCSPFISPIETHLWPLLLSGDGSLWELHHLSFFSFSPSPSLLPLFPFFFHILGIKSVTNQLAGIPFGPPFTSGSLRVSAGGGVNDSGQQQSALWQLGLNWQLGWLHRVPCLMCYSSQEEREGVFLLADFNQPLSIFLFPLFADLNQLPLFCYQLSTDHSRESLYWKSDFATPEGQQETYVSACSQSELSSLLIQPEGESPMVSTPIITVPSCLHQSRYSPLCKWKIMFAPITGIQVGWNALSPSGLGGSGSYGIWSSVQLKHFSEGCLQ
jgi:hypothetical protein